MHINDLMRVTLKHRDARLGKEQITVTVCLKLVSNCYKAQPKAEVIKLGVREVS